MGYGESRENRKMGITVYVFSYFRDFHHIPLKLDYRWTTVGLPLDYRWTTVGLPLQMAPGSTTCTVSRMRKDTVVSGWQMKWNHTLGDGPPGTIEQ